MTFAIAAFNTVEDAGGARALGQIVDMTPAVLSHKVNPNDKDNHLSVPQMVKIIRATGDYSMLYALATDLGHMAVRTEVDGLTQPAIERMLTETIGHVGAFLNEVTASVADGNVTSSEMKRIDKELHDLVQGINVLRAMCNAMKPVRAGGK